MKRLLLSAAAVALMTPAAFAADLPIYEPAPLVAPAPEAAYDWSGIYIGVHGGWGWGESEDEFGAEIDDIEGFVVGGQVGYNWQWNYLVFGVEGDGSYSDQDGSDFGVDADVSYLASARGRLGFAFDRFMVYGTGGAGFAGLDFDGPFGDDDADFFGYTYGGGAEVLLTQNISVGVEYLHYEFEDEGIDLGGGDFDVDFDNDVVRGRVNVKFNSLFGG